MACKLLDPAKAKQLFAANCKQSYSYAFRYRDAMLKQMK